MIKIYGLEDFEKWDELVVSFPNYDVYYLSGYVRAFELHGDGTPQLLYYESEGLRAIYVYMLRQINSSLADTITPYGYGGVLFDGLITPDKKEHFREEFEMTMREHNIICNFVRYHPVLANAESMRQISEVIDLGHTIAMDLTSPDVIWQNIHTKNRNMIRKAEKNGVEIKIGQGMDLFDKFMDIYNATMEKDEAEEYYFFKRQFYESIHNDLHDNYRMFYAEYEGKIIAMSIMIFANGMLNYHLSGSNIEYRNLAPSNLLLYQAALWGCENGMRTFHLGGGVGSGEDNLYKFKAAFNKNSDCQFSIGKQIFNQQIYDEQVYIRKKTDPLFNMESNFFPLYRSGNK